LGIGAGIFAAPPRSLAAQSDIVFTAVLDKTEYTAEEAVNLTFTLKNRGKSPVYVNKRFFFGSEEAPKKQKEVYAVITSPSGQKLPFKSPYETGYPKSDYFELLEPGQEVKSEYPRNLRGNFEFTEEGVYTVNAVYQNAFGRELGLEAFSQRLTAEPVKFAIKNSGH
jgi:hypothetical protein